MRTKIITYLPRLDNYKDRLTQIIRSVPRECHIEIFTKSKETFTSHNGVTIRFLTDKFYNKSFFLKLKFFFYLISQKKHDVLILDWFCSFNYILLAKFLFKKINYVYSPVISNYGWVYKRLNNLVPLKDFRYDYIRFKGSFEDYITTKYCDSLIVQSKKLKSFYSKVYKIDLNKIYVNYNSNFDQNFSTLKKNNYEKHEIGFLGNVESHKGTNEMYEIFKILKKHKLIIAGRCNGKNNNRIFDKLKKLDNVEYISFLSNEEKIEFFKRIDALILLSYHEGSPRVITEFINYGKPIFVYDNPGLDYCKNLVNVFMYDYGEVDKVIVDLSLLNNKIKNERNKIVIKSDLKKIFKKIIDES
jgi:glycosyltransferase involved in cell wall biosynthesis